MRGGESGDGIFQSEFTQVFSVMSWNLFKWKGVEVHDWPGEREIGMKKTIASLNPDIICTQETSPEYLDAIFGVNAHYRCIVPSEAVVRECCQSRDAVRKIPFSPKNFYYPNSANEETFTGWLDEGNIVYRSDKFQYVSHGVVDVGLEEAEARRPKRRLFWLRLCANNRTILVSTAHLTWEGGSVVEQAAPYPSERSAQASKIIAALNQIRLNDEKNGHAEPVIFCGDMNDSWHVPFKMREAGLFAYDLLLNMPSEITHPARPCFHEERVPSQTRDWIFSSSLKPLLGRVCGDMVLGLNRHPSDHFPVFCIYEVPKNSK